MKGSFPGSLALVLVHEGGYSNHPADPGGATMNGITQRVYDGFRSTKGLAHQDVRRLGADERTEIYRLQYWQPIHGDELLYGLDYAVFDGAVNSGYLQSGKWLQRSLNVMSVDLLKVDGWIGLLTLGAMQRLANRREDLIRDMLKRRMAFLKRLKTWPVFGEGWSTRVRDVERRALTWRPS